MEFVLPPAWRALLQEETEKPYWKALAERVDAAYEVGTYIRRVRCCFLHLSGHRRIRCAS